MDPKQKRKEQLLELGVPKNRLDSFEKHRIYYDAKSGNLVIQRVNGGLTAKSVTPQKLVECALHHKRLGNPLPKKILRVIYDLRPDALSEQEKRRLEMSAVKKKQ